jgi:hypothetical protein
MWKQKYAPKHKDFNLNPVTESIADSVKQLNLPDDVENDVIMAMKEKPCFVPSQGEQQGFTSSTANIGTWQQNKQNSNKNKKDKKNNNKTLTSTWSVTCWFCNKPGHTQINCHSHISLNNPLTWKA